LYGKWKKPSQELTQLLDTIVQPYECSQKKMFGSVTYFVNNNMFTGVHEDTIFVRLSEEDRKAIQEEDPDCEHFEPLEGKKMREYMVLSENICRNIPKIEKWLERSFLFASSLPIKLPKKRKVK